MDTVIVIMLKNNESGFLEKELLSIDINENEEFLVNIYAAEENGLKLHITVSTETDVEDWQYNAVLDYYDTDVFSADVISVSEIEDSYNPQWELVIDYCDDARELGRRLDRLLSVHRRELEDVYGTIADKKGEYSKNEE